MEISLQHFHIVSQNKYNLAEWYEEHLGFQIMNDVEKLGEKNGPLLISGDKGKTFISIFNQYSAELVIGTKCIPAFHLKPSDFLKLYKHFNHFTPNLEVQDHRVFCSFYVHDPDQTLLEFSCSDYQTIKSLLENEGIPCGFWTEKEV